MAKIHEATKIALFKGKKIRKTLFQNEWWFSVIDIVEALTGNDRPRKYWNDLKTKIMKEGYTELSEKIGQLKLKSPDGKKYLTDCANTETVFRIIQTIPSSKAEPFKRWLAKVGYKKVKGLKRENLRDHMDDFELIFTMLGERSTTEIHRNEDSKGVKKLKDDAKAGGEIAGNARIQLETKLRRSIVSKKNYLPQQKSK